MGVPAAGIVIIVDNDEPVIVDAFAVAETTVEGRVRRGDLSSTYASDNVSEVIRENRSNGSRAIQYSQLDHRWTFEVTAGTSVTFSVEAHHRANSEGDDFVFSYSTGGAFFDMVIVTKTADDNTTQTFELPNTLNGTVTVKVEDLDRSPGNRRRDRITIDYLVIRTIG